LTKDVGVHLFLNPGTTGGILASVARRLDIDGLGGAMPAIVAKNVVADGAPLRLNDDRIAA